MAQQSLLTLLEVKDEIIGQWILSFDLSLSLKGLSFVSVEYLHVVPSIGPDSNLIPSDVSLIDGLSISLLVSVEMPSVLHELDGA